MLIATKLGDIYYYVLCLRKYPEKYKFYVIQ